jgi:hypothetical protein
MGETMRHSRTGGALAPVLVGALSGALMLVAGCAAVSGSDRTESAMVRVLVREINIREEGADCAGTGGYVYFHNRAPFRVLDEAGKTLTEGKLPPGKSVRVFEEDLGVPRIPTYCEFAVPVEVPQRDGYRLIVKDKPAIDLTVNTEQGLALVAVVPR